MLFLLVKSLCTEFQHWYFSSYETSLVSATWYINTVIQILQMSKHLFVDRHSAKMLLLLYR